VEGRGIGREEEGGGRSREREGDGDLDIVAIATGISLWYQLTDPDECSLVGRGREGERSERSKAREKMERQFLTYSF
jgi:hypothetical protein